MLKTSKAAIALTVLSSVLLTACNDDNVPSVGNETASAAITAKSAIAEVNTSVNQWQQYQTLASDIKDSYTTADFSSLGEQAENLTRLSTQLLPQFIEKNDECKMYLSVAINSVDVMLNQSLEQIEADYHSDGKLPPMSDVKCYHAKDLLVHPATVAVIAKKLPENDESRSMIHDEIAEVLEHLKQVQQLSVQN